MKGIKAKQMYLKKQNQNRLLNKRKINKIKMNLKNQMKLIKSNLYRLIKSLIKMKN